MKKLDVHVLVAVLGPILSVGEDRIHVQGVTPGDTAINITVDHDLAVHVESIPGVGVEAVLILRGALILLDTALDILTMMIVITVNMKAKDVTLLGTIVLLCPVEEDMLAIETIQSQVVA